MPEPVVIMGPAGRPAEPSAGPPEHGSDPAQRAKGGIGRRILRWASEVLARALWAASLATLRAVKRYPRISLGAGTSILILGAVWLTQPHPGTGKRTIPTNKIAGNLFAPAAKVQNDPGGANQKAAVVDRSDTSRSEPGARETARPDAIPQPNLAASAKSVDDLPAFHSLTDGSKSEQDHQSPEKPAAGVELAAGPKAEQELAPASALESRSATLLAPPVPDPVHAPPLPIAQQDKHGADAAQAPPLLDPPAAAPALTAMSPPIEPSPVSASANDPLQIAPALELAAKEPKPAQDPAPLPVAKAAEGDVPTAGDKLPDGAASDHPKPIPSPVASVELGPASPVDSSTGKPKLSDGDPKQPETPESNVADRMASTPEHPAPGPAHEPPRAASMPISETLAASGTARPESTSSPTSESNQTSTRAAEAEPRVAKSRTQDSRAEQASPENPAGAGWVSIPNSGRLPIDGADDVATKAGDSDPAIGSRSIVARDMRAHTAKDVGFELESSQPRTPARGAGDQAQTGERFAAGAGSQAERGARSDAPRVESVPHLVERGENFWSISRQYYNSGRYYRALWKANAERYPDISVLHVGDTIMIPPPEELDPKYIVAPRTGASSTLAGARGSPGSGRDGDRQDSATDPAEPSASSPSRRTPTSAARSSQASRLADGVPARSSRATDGELDLSISDGRARAGRSGELAVNDDARNDEPETRTSARPRRSDTAAPGRPIYKVRPYDTLRSIARDTLDDPRRASEILELNRGLIDDPTQLIAGQILELPEDARTTVRRSASRR